MASGTRTPKSSKGKPAKTYRHPESESLMRPEVGTQAQFKKKKPPQKYRYDDSLSPALEWDGQNPARERGEARIAKAEEELVEAKKKLASAARPEGISEVKAHVAAAQEAVRELKAMSKPFLNWAGKAERLSFEVPTLPLFIHERLSTRAILETLKGHKRDKQVDMFDLWGDPQHSIADQVMRAYEFPDKWVNRMILGDSLVVMNSLLRYEKLGGQVQVIYIDPPYGVKFGSNFQPFVRRRDVKHSEDDYMTREPEMVQAYRDTWELGLHSYLTYLRDRFYLARDLLASTGSIFVQISDENLHHVRELLDETFGSENFAGLIAFRKTGGLGTKGIKSVNDFILWYARDKEKYTYHPLFLDKSDTAAGEFFQPVDKLREFVQLGRTPEVKIPQYATEYITVSLTSSGTTPSCIYPYEFNGKTYWPVKGYSWKPNRDSMDALKTAGRLIATGETLRWIYYKEDFPVSELTSYWDDTGGASDKVYVVQTSAKVIERCLLMTSNPGDLVIDPTCGGGTTAYVAEHWGRRWITMDTSRVPLALARQRLLTATYPWYELGEESRGPASGFVYKPKQNKKGEEIGGIVPHITLESIANNEPPKEEVLVDRPEIQSHTTRVTGPFTFEATIPTPQDFEDIRAVTSTAPERDNFASFVDRMLEILRKSPVLRLEGNKTVTLKNVRPPAKTLSLSAEATIPNGHEKPVAFVFGPENGAVSEKLVYQAAKEANAKDYSHLYVIGFAIQPNARMLVEQCADVVGIGATYVQATPDLMMGDLLKNMRSSQIFSVCGLPEAEIRRATKVNGIQRYEVELLGLDVFDPVTMGVHHRSADDVPAWFLDTDYNGLCFHVSQAFFPRTSAWESLKKALKGEYEDAVWSHLAGSISSPFEVGDYRQVALKVIDERGNELMIVKPLGETT